MLENEMSPKSDLEQRIRETYSLWREYEDLARLSGDPKERARAQRNGQEQREFLQHDLTEYAALCRHLNVPLPGEMAEIGAVVDRAAAANPELTNVTARSGGADIA